MSDFKEAYYITMGHEGGYVNDPTDKGGETYKGISRNNWPNWPGWMLIDSIKGDSIGPVGKVLGNISMLREAVMAFYFEHYWEKLNLEKLAQPIADEIFDTAVNQGGGTAAKYLQRALNLLNESQKHYADLKVDGGIGEKTISAYRAYIDTAIFETRSVQKNVKTLLKVLNGLQLMKFIKITEKNESQEKYFYGWVNRV